MAKAGGKGGGTTKDPLAINAGCGADELAHKPKLAKALKRAKNLVLTQRDSVRGSPTAELPSTWNKRCSFRGEPWKRSPESTSSISIILALRLPTALMACTRNLPSQMNHDVMA
jgi:hypothetical protein